MIEIDTYISETVRSIDRIDSGHINTSFLVKADADYILQRLNARLFGDCLEAIRGNYLAYRQACRDIYGSSEDWICPQWIENREGDFFTADDEGGIWRMYRYIPGDIIQAATYRHDCPHGSGPVSRSSDCDLSRDDSVYEIGLGLGRMHRILVSCDKRDITPVIPHLFDLHHYYREYLNIKDTLNPRIEELEKIIRNNITDQLEIRVPGDGVIHGDAKTANMVFRDGRVIGFIDLDTIMPGSLYDDLSDCIRSCDTGGGEADRDMIARFLEGYEEGSDTALSPDAIREIIRNTMKHRFMLGLRYYTDYLEGNRYFREEYPGQNLDKARRLLLEYLYERISPV